MKSLMIHSAIDLSKTPRPLMLVTLPKQGEIEC